MDPWVVGSPVRVHKWRHPFISKTLEFLLLFAFSFFLYSYFSGFPFFFYYNIQLSTFVFPFFAHAHALDRKYMFLICNGILAFLAKNLNYSSSRLNYTGIIESDGDGLKQITKLQIVEENIASIEYAPKMTAAKEEEIEQQPEQDYGDIHNGAKEMKVEGNTLESEEWEDEVEEDDDEEELKESKDVEDASVSTEELNQKFEEFIRKMKEEIRIEAQ